VSAPAIPIVVLAYNAHDITRRCIESIITNTATDFEIILVDNGSAPTFEDTPEYHLVRLPDNLYYTGGINAGIRFALREFPDFEHIVLLNNDITVNPGWLASLRQGFSTEVSGQVGPVGVVGNKHLLMSDPGTVVHAGVADLIGGTHIGGVDQPAFDQPHDGVWVTFACVGLSRACLEAAGLLDERMLHFYSDTDFCLRANMAGFRVRYEPTSTVNHAHSHSYKDAAVDVAPDRNVFVAKWFGDDLNNKILGRICLDADSKEQLELRRTLRRR